ncbi:hypothetical protein [Polaribacter cellanae]|uniref:hypothetical protein n=1 Tax=Polaribacter cellanae TaxID=2818493 RepID=UPI001FB67595|nr:hypothetical protein [Polaribacter cellanae]
MNKQTFFFFISILLSVSSLFSQRDFGRDLGVGQNENDPFTIRDSLNTGKINVTLSGKTKYTDYKVFFS